NDAMGDFIAGCIDENMSGPGRVLLLGLTFKENVPDLRNTKVIDVIGGLRDRGHEVLVHDPVADSGEAERFYGIPLVSSLADQTDFDAVVGAVRHDEYLALDDTDLGNMVRIGGLIADIKGLWRGMTLPEDRHYWQL
ncbi:MAG: nucleotide sugar dehydrogenase, partial [Rhodospirillaceae bacterium]|nr:nucleotide sugar dehydrogenase [Rhodospirillaceae bacterium]